METCSYQGGFFVVFENPEAVFQRDFFAKFKGKHLCQSLFFNKVAGLRPTTLFKNRLWHRCFPVNFGKFLRTPIFIEHLWWLLFKTMLFEFGRTRIFVEETCVCFIKRPSFRRDFILYFTSRLNALLELLPSTLSLFIGLVHEVVTQVF